MNRFPRLRKNKPLPESEDERLRRLSSQRAARQYRSERRERFRGGASLDVGLVNIFAEFGINFLSLTPQQAFSQVPERCEGRKVAGFSEKALAFLGENFEIQQEEDQEGRVLLHFRKGEKMNLISAVAQASGQPRKTVRAVYEALAEQIQKGLKEDRKVRLPQIGRIGIKSRSAKPKRKGIMPFTGKEGWFKARPASNKVRFRPSKDLKDFVGKLPVEKTKKKKKGKK